MDSGVSYHSENLQNTDTTEGSIENGEEHFLWNFWQQENSKQSEAF